VNPVAQLAEAVKSAPVMWRFPRPIFILGLPLVLLGEEKRLDGEGRKLFSGKAILAKSNTIRMEEISNISSSNGMTIYYNSMFLTKHYLTCF
jgi:hypothetical protein